MSLIIIISLFWRCCLSRDVMAYEANLVTTSPLACKFTPVPDTFKASILMHISVQKGRTPSLSPSNNTRLQVLFFRDEGITTWKMCEKQWGFSRFFLSCKAYARVKLTKTGHGQHSSTLVVICVVLCIVCVQMCTVLLPPGDNPIAVNKYIIYHRTFLPKGYELPDVTSVTTL
jgi:hypothetical protein